MKSLIPIALLVISLPLSARTWTDATGRTIEADFLRADNSHVVLMFKGRETKLPLTRLSETDQQWIKDRKESSTETIPDTQAGEFTLCGATLQSGGPVVTVETPLTDDALKAFRRRSAKPEKLKMAIKLPVGFDPSKPQQVLWVSAAINNDGERKAGNCGAIHAYANTAVSAGWLVIAADTDLGNPRGEDNIKEDGADQAVHQQAIDTLVATWPGFKSWNFACCGFSGGAKATFFRVGQLLATNLNVAGMYLGGCNQDMTEAAREEVRFSKSKLRKVRVFISNGKSDTISTVAHAEAIEKTIHSNFGETQLHLYEGGHGIDQGEFKKALDWFATP